MACAHSLVTDAFYVGDEFNGRIKHPQPQVLNADDFTVSVRCREGVTNGADYSQIAVEHW